MTLQNKFIDPPKDYTRLVFTKVDKNHIELVEDWQTPFGTVPKGFVSDGASIPKPLWWVMHPFGELLEGSVLHDYFYAYPKLTKAYADSAFKTVVNDYAKINRTAKWKIHVAYWFVRKFGRGNY